MLGEAVGLSRSTIVAARPPVTLSKGTFNEREHPPVALEMRAYGYRLYQRTASPG